MRIYNINITNGIRSITNGHRSIFPKFQILACFSFAELVSHWCLTRFTDPSYKGDANDLEIKVTAPRLIDPTLHSQPAESPPLSGKGCRHQSLDTMSQEFTTEIDGSGVILSGERNGNSKFQIAGNNLNFDPGLYPGQEAGTNKKGCHLEDGRKRHLHLGGRRMPFVKDEGKLLDPERERIGTVDQMAGYSNSGRHINWVWSNCAACGFATPPRCHHCPLCRKCILKRHHHCFFTGVCIGAANQRHFLAFMFWAKVVTMFGTAHMLPYAFGHVIATEQASCWDLIPPVVLYRAVLGYTDALHFPLCVTFWMVLAFTLGAIVFFFRTLTFTVLGVTDVEFAKRVKVVDTRRMQNRLRYVLGENWLLNFVVPFRRRTLFNEDAIHWPYIKRYSR